MSGYAASESHFGQGGLPIQNSALYQAEELELELGGFQKYK